MVNSSSWLAISCATSPKTLGFGKSYSIFLWGINCPVTRDLHVIEDLQRGTGKNPFLLVLWDIKTLDRGNRPVNRPEQVRIVTAHHHVIRSDHISHHH